MIGERWGLVNCTMERGQDRCPLPNSGNPGDRANIGAMRFTVGGSDAHSRDSPGNMGRRATVTVLGIITGRDPDGLTIGEAAGRRERH